MSYSADRRYNVTKTGLIGNQRETMLRNELHYLPQLGKSRARGHQLPEKTFTYGVANVKLDGGVAEGKDSNPYCWLLCQRGVLHVITMID